MHAGGKDPGSAVAGGHHRAHIEDAGLVEGDGIGQSCFREFFHRDGLTGKNGFVSGQRSSF